MFSEVCEDAVCLLFFRVLDSKSLYMNKLRFVLGRVPQNDILASVRKKSITWHM